MNVGKLGEQITAETTFDENTTVYAHWYLPGDINGDGEVDARDLVRYMKYLAGEDVYVVEEALDCNGDGSVNSKDLTRLMKYLSGETTEIY